MRSEVDRLHYFIRQWRNDLDEVLMQEEDVRNTEVSDLIRELKVIGNSTLDVHGDLGLHELMALRVPR